MERNVVTLETARRLKTAGFPQDTAHWYWTTTDGGEELELLCGDDMGSRYSDYNKEFGYDFAAPIAQEIADRLPEQTDLALAVWRDQEVWIAQYEGDEDAPPKWLSEGLTMAEALANLYLKLNQPKEGK